MNYTSVKQSKKLLELGLNPESADFEYKCVGYTMHTTRPTDNFKYKLMLKECDIPHEPMYDVPCWSVGALMDLIPISIYEKLDKYDLHIAKDDALYYCFSYSRLSEFTQLQVPIHATFEKSLIDACFNVVMWLLESGLLGHKVN